MEWFRVKERLPPIDEKVITYDAYYLETDMGFYDPSSITKTGWRCREYMDKTVTHWMPLPQPPGKDEMDQD